MLRTAIFLFFASIVTTNALKISPSNCGTRPLFQTGDKIVNGTVATPGDWAWSVSVNTKGIFGQHFCGGVLIRKQWVLCAAHCFSGGNRSMNVKVIHDRSRPESWSANSDVEVVFTHEKYNPQKLTDDIAIIRLKDPIEYDDTYVVPACIAETPSDFKDGATQFEDMLFGEPGWLTGWGREKYGGSVQRLKYEVRLDTNTAATCENDYPGLYVKDVEICAGNSTSLAGACQGDSGGPYVFKSPKDGKWYNFGLTSWGYSCGIGTVFTRVSTYIDWIKDKMGKYPDEDLEN